MEIKFYYVLQDFIGILTVLIGFKSLVMGFFNILKNGCNLSKCSFIASDLIYIYSGTKLVVSYFSINIWCIFILGLLLSRIINKLGYKFSKVNLI